MERLISVLERELRPFQDMYDPTALYVGRDLSTLPEAEQRGFELARIPRSRVSAEEYSRVSIEEYLKDGKELISESAIFRARVFSWLSNPNLHIHCTANLWLREQLLEIVRADVERGHHLSWSETRILYAFLQRESSETTRYLAEEVLSDAGCALNQSRAERTGLPPLPPLLPKPPHRESPPVRLLLNLTEHSEPIGLRASSWPRSFGESASVLRRAMTGELGPLTRLRLFALEVDPGRATLSGEIEDELDYQAEPLSTLTLDMVRGGWAHTEIETFLQTTVSLAILDELRRRRLFKAGSSEVRHGAFGAGLGLHLGARASRTPTLRVLIEVTPDVLSRHLPLDGRQGTGDASPRERGRGDPRRPHLSEDEILKQSMEWDYVPAQLWEVTICTRMADVATARAMRELGPDLYCHRPSSTRGERISIRIRRTQNCGSMYHEALALVTASTSW